MDTQVLEIPMTLSVSEVTVPMTVTAEIVVSPMPPDWGHITWDGRVITVS
jgi:hypothetical protein